MTTAQAMTTMTGQKTTGRATMMATEMVWTTETMTRRMDEPWLLLLAAVARRRTVWAAPLSDLHRVLANRDLRRGEWLLPPAPMLLGISRT